MNNNNNKIKYQFTRHIQSCNNISSIFNKKQEPSATQYGIFHTTLFAINNQNRFTSKRVFVSNLLRTWITAFILYGINFKQKYKNNTTNINNDKNTLELYVAPYLKEKITSFRGFKIEKGNYPQEITKTLHNFSAFLNKYFKIPEFSKEMIHFPDKIKITIPPPSDFFKNENKNGNNYNRQKFIFTKIDNEYIFNCKEKSKIKDTIGPKCGDIRFLDDGNLEEFIKWHATINFKNNNIVHVVTHSQIMFQYLIDKNINSKQYETHKEENCWSFLTNGNSNKIVYKKGVPEYLHKITSQIDPVTLEKIREKYSLCIKNTKNIFNNKCKSMKIKK